jgi:hypothetical protein
MIVGDATVSAGGVLFLRGTVTGNLIVQPGGEAHVDGTVSGSILNDGRAIIAGVVGGTVSGSGDTTFKPDSIVGATHRTLP